MYLEESIIRIKEKLFLYLGKTVRYKDENSFRLFSQKIDELENIEKRVEEIRKHLSFLERDLSLERDEINSKLDKTEKGKIAYTEVKKVMQSNQSSKSITIRTKRNTEKELKLKNELGRALTIEWGVDFYRNESQLIFTGTNKKVLCKYSSFRKNVAKWFWGVSSKYWSNWAKNDYLGLILENDDGNGFSYILMSPQEALTLFEKCSESRSEKKINMRIYKDGSIHFQELYEFDISKHIKKLCDI